MSFDLPLLEIFLGVLGFGLSIMFCTSFCRACSRFREQQMEREMWRHSEQEGRPPSIFVIPLPRSTSQQEGEDHLRVTQHSQELRTPPRYSTAVYCGPPPSYNELEFKSDDLPPPYSAHDIPPPPHTDVV
ncbi:hypothetical protein Q5P01_015126 [Channa striata]|uniref:Uncharacterized protein n=1 Tax=Channa striata TaxID=64152 RepID=A0AA88MHX8_CHASR|nr:hypothetical protein Q5P01_015126 [Channa striata]